MSRMRNGKMIKHGKKASTGDRIWPRVLDRVWDREREKVQVRVRAKVCNRARDMVWMNVCAGGLSSGVGRGIVWDRVEVRVNARVIDLVKNRVKSDGEEWDRFEQNRQKANVKVWNRVSARIWSKPVVGDKLWGVILDKVFRRVADQVNDRVKSRVRDREWDRP